MLRAYNVFCKSCGPIALPSFTAFGSVPRAGGCNPKGAPVFNDFVPSDPDAVRPFVHEDGQTVSMHFDISSIQSRMRRDDPIALDLDYTRAMMGFLMFEPEPRSILMIGLGGGSLAKYCRKHLPSADITVVENNPHVIELRDVFFVPPDDRLFRVVCDDGAAFVAAATRRYEVVLVDGFTYDGQPESLCSERFYADCRKALTETGVLVVNLHTEQPACGVLRSRIAKAMNSALSMITTEAGVNQIVFASASAEPDQADKLRERWAALADVHKRTLDVTSSRKAPGLRWPRLASNASAQGPAHQPFEAAQG
jgi:spermidine synthase